MIFYTADLHFGYSDILAATGRPFGSVGEMDEALIENWNRTVAEGDTVFVVGDISCSGGEIPHRQLARLNGYKHLIRGNHDTGLPRAEELYRHFASVTDFWELDDGGNHILLFHYPIVYERRGYMIHGHTHNGRGHTWELLRELPHVLNAGVDVNFFRPVSLPELIENNRKFYSGQYPELFPAPPALLRREKGLPPKHADFRPLPLPPE